MNALLSKLLLIKNSKNLVAYNNKKLIVFATSNVIHN
jgi:hypothetical protein